MTRLRIASWNINSLRLRWRLIERIIAQWAPDVLCLQETKVHDDDFPADVPGRLGFEHYLRRGMKGYNGVAIFSRMPLATGTPRNWCDKDDSRHLEAALATPSGPVELHNFYIPAGGDIPDPAQNSKFQHKLDFLREATAWFGGKPPKRGVLLGDLNIAPLQDDVWSHKQLLGVVSHTPIEVELLSAWRDAHWVDAVRHLRPPPEKLYTWWSYRNQDWRASDRGRRLDHIWITPDLLPSLQAQAILKDARDWEQTSDHVPISITLDL